MIYASEYPTPQEALDAITGEGGTVRFQAEDYLLTEALRPKSGTTMLGDGVASRIRCGDQGWPLLGNLDNFGLINVRGKTDMRIEKLGLWGTKLAGQFESPKLIFLMDTERVDISSCTLENTAWEGIWEGGNFSVRKIMIRNNFVRDVGYPNQYGGLPAIQLNTAGAIVKGNILEDVGSGIGSSGTAASIKNNRITGIQTIGIGTGDGGDVEASIISGNTISFEASPDRKRVGLSLQPSPPGSPEHITHVTGNTISMSAVLGSGSATNLLLQEEFDDPYFSKTAITVIADLVDEGVTNNQHRILVQPIFPSEDVYTLSGDYQYIDLQWVRLQINDAFWVNFDIQNAVVGNIGAGVVDATIEDLGSGRFRCSVTSGTVPPTFGNLQWIFLNSNSGSSPVYYTGTNRTARMSGPRLIKGPITGAGDITPVGIESNAARVKLSDNSIGIEGYGRGIYAYGRPGGAHVKLADNYLSVINPPDGGFGQNWPLGSSQAMGGRPNEPGASLFIQSSDNTMLGFRREDASYSHFWETWPYPPNAFLRVITSNDVTDDGRLQIGELYFAGGEYDNKRITLEWSNAT